MRTVVTIYLTDDGRFRSVIDDANDEDVAIQATMNLIDATATLMGSHYTKLLEALLAAGRPFDDSTTWVERG